MAMAGGDTLAKALDLASTRGSSSSPERERGSKAFDLKFEVVIRALHDRDASFRSFAGDEEERVESEIRQAKGPK